MRQSIFTLVTLLALLFGLSACQSTDDKELTLEQLPVEVSYRERKMLPPGATLTVTLEDVSKMDVASVVIDSKTTTLNGAPPYQMTLEYSPSQIDPRMNYALRARIEHQGKLLFINQQHIPAFSDAAQSTRKILVQSVNHTPNSIAPKLAVIDGNWSLIQLGEKNAADLGSNTMPTLLIKDDQLSGFAGCNRYHGTFTQQNQQLALGPMAMTKMLCQGQAQNIEDDYLQALNKVDNYKVNSATLKLRDEDDQVLLIFTRMP